MEKETTFTQVIIGALLMFAAIFVFIVSIGTVFTNWKSAQAEDLCVFNYNAQKTLNEDVDFEFLRFSSDNEQIKTLSDAERHIKGLELELSTTNKEFNKLKILVGCLVDKK